MTLYINTVNPDEIIVALRDRHKELASKKVKAARKQAEKLVPAIEQLLVSQKVTPKKLTKIVVANQGGSFTSLRIGVITANALAYALKIPVVAEFMKKKNKKFGSFSIVEPSYDREPTIGISKKLKY